MAWLSGERCGYNTDEWTNRHHPSGHFGRGADGIAERAHACTSGGVTYLFDRHSFALFRNSSDASTVSEDGAPLRLPSRLHLVTSTRRLSGYDVVRPLCSKAFGRLQHKAARDVDLVDALSRAEAAEEYDWEGLRRWLRQTSGPLSAIGALRLFAADEAAAKRLYVEVEMHDQRG